MERTYMWMVTTGKLECEYSYCIKYIGLSTSFMSSPLQESSTTKHIHTLGPSYVYCIIQYNTFPTSRFMPISPRPNPCLVISHSLLSIHSNIKLSSPFNLLTTTQHPPFFKHSNDQRHPENLVSLSISMHNITFCYSKWYMIADSLHKIILPKSPSFRTYMIEGVTSKHNAEKRRTI